MSKSIPPTDAEDLARRQGDEYLKAVGTFAVTLPDVINEAYYVAQALPPKPFYLNHPNIRFIWELLDTNERSEAFRLAVDAWVEGSGIPNHSEGGLTVVQAEGNIQRAARHVNRTIRSETRPWSGFAVFRMKAREGINWSLLDDHGRTDASEPHPASPMPQTVVFIALTRLDHSNGFFMTLEAGQDVCIDSRARILYPPTGGGIGLAIWLRL